MSFLHDYVRYAEECTDSPSLFHEYGALSVVSSVIGNRIYYQFGHLRLRANLWMLYVAPSSSFRKSTAMSIAKGLVQNITPTHILPNEYSAEKLIEILSKNPVGVFFISEFKTMMGLMQREYMAGAKSFLTEVYDCPEKYTREIRGRAFEVNSPCLSILGCTTLDWMTDSMKEDDLAGGFLPRFLLICPREKLRTLALPGEADNQIRRQLVDQLDRIRKVGGSGEEGRCTMSANVKASYQAWFTKFEDEFCKGGTWDAFYTRLQTYCLKIAMLVQVAESYSTEISMDSMKWAQHLTRCLATDLRDVREDMAFTREAREQERVIKVLRENLQGFLWRDLLRRTRMSARSLTEILKTLRGAERVISIPEGKTVRWRLKGDGEEAHKNEG